MTSIREPSPLPALVGNLFSRSMNHGLVGHRVSVQGVPVSFTQAAPYAAAIGESTVALLTSGMVHPFFLARLLNPLFYQILLDRRLRLNLLRMVHAGQRARWHRPIHIGESLDLTLSIGDFEKTHAGEILRLEGTVSNGPETVAELSSTFLVRGASGGKKPVPHQQKCSEPFFKINMPTAPDQARRYALASGDRNPIHTNPVAAFLAGLEGTVMHGLCVLTMATSSLTSLCRNGELNRLVAIDGRFRRPVRPGTSLIIFGQAKSTERLVPFEVIDNLGRPVISHGLIEFR